MSSNNQLSRLEEHVHLTTPEVSRPDPHRAAILYVPEERIHVPNRNDSPYQER